MAHSSAADFEFYVNFVKPLILTLPASEDKALASAWLERLKADTSASESLKTNYIKLLLYFLQKHKLGGPFCQHPNTLEELPQFPENQNLFETGNALTKDTTATPQPYTMDFSADLSTYVACQEIESVGAHCYYALSNKPITGWNGFNRSLFPPGLKPGGAVVGLLDDDEATESTVPDEELEKKKKDFVEKLQKKIKTDNKKVMLLVAPIGQVPSEKDDRKQPTWGSNLLQPLGLDESDDDI